MSNRNFPELRWKSDIRLLHQFYICYANNTFAIWFKFGYNFRNSIFTNVYRHPSVSSSSLGIEKQWTHFLQQVFLVDILDDILYFAGDLLPWNLIVLNPVISALKLSFYSRIYYSKERRFTENLIEHLDLRRYREVRVKLEAGTVFKCVSHRKIA